jgi:hypothetical protein
LFWYLSLKVQSITAVKSERTCFIAIILIRRNKPERKNASNKSKKTFLVGFDTVYEI